MIELSVIIPALNEERNIERLISAVRDRIISLVDGAEIIIVDGGSKDKTCEIAARSSAKVVMQKERGYGSALIAGFAAAKGDYILTMDADLSHEPAFFADMKEKIQNNEVVIASRYVPGGRATMPAFRRLLSILLNRIFAVGLSLPIKDISSGFRLYRASALRCIKIKSRGFDICEEIIIRLYTKGCRISEVPFHYKPRTEGKSHVRLARFAIAYLKTFGRMCRLRYSRESAERISRKHENTTDSGIPAAPAEEKAMVQ